MSLKFSISVLKLIVIIFMCLRRVNSFYATVEQRNVVYYDTEECNVKIELRVRI